MRCQTAGALLLLAAVSLAGCATMPPGPSILVMPGNGKSFEAFQVEDGVCRQWAQNQAGWNANQTVNENVAGGAIAGGALGAAAGALIGAASGAAGPGAAIGAGAGLLGGAFLGATQAPRAGYEVQRRYDNAYQQCMYAKGNQIPGGVQPTASRRAVPPPPPPPPVGYYSAPPPAYAPAPLPRLPLRPL
jgi:hypothetical protein